MKYKLLDFSGMLSRAMGASIDEESNSIACTRCVGSGPGVTRYLDVCTFELAPDQLPLHWRENLRHELRKYELAASTLSFEVSTSCSAQRKKELLAKVRAEASGGLGGEAANFIAISFQLARDHDVLILANSFAPLGELGI